MNRMSLPLGCFAVFFTFLWHSAMAFAPDEPECHVDPRVELAAVLCRLAGYPEYQDVRFPAYDRAVMDRFGPYRSHKSVQLMKKLREERGIQYSAAIDVALLARDEVSWEPRIPLSPLPSYIDQRWDEKSAKAYLRAARQFARDSRAATFFRQQAATYTGIESAYLEQLAGNIDFDWYRAQFRMPDDSKVRILPSALTGAASYGILVRPAPGSVEINAVISLPKMQEGDSLELPRDRAAGLLVHELSHPLVNPWVQSNAESLRAPGEKLFEEAKETLRSHAYSNWETMMYESLVRAATLRYFLDHEQPKIVRLSLDDDREKGFWWTEDLAAVFARREGTAGSVLDDRASDIRPFFDEWASNPAKRISEKQALVAAAREERRRHGPQIVSLSPQDGDTATDPSVGMLEVRFDRPMASPLSFYGEMPKITGKPSWDEARSTLRIPVLLTPGRKYVMSLNKEDIDGGFQSESGERLVPRTWTFQAKP